MVVTRLPDVGEIAELKLAHIEHVPNVVEVDHAFRAGIPPDYHGPPDI